MTPDLSQRLSAWRTEVAVELEEARKSLPPLLAEHATAVAAAGDAESAFRDLQAVLDAAFNRLTSPVAQRLAWLRAESDDARSRVSRAHGAVEAARGRVAELERAARQLDHLIQPADAEAA